MSHQPRQPAQQWSTFSRGNLQSRVYVVWSPLLAVIRDAFDPAAHRGIQPVGCQPLRRIASPGRGHPIPQADSESEGQLSDPAARCGIQLWWSTTYALALPGPDFVRLTGTPATDCSILDSHKAMRKVSRRSSPTGINSFASFCS